MITSGPAPSAASSDPSGLPAVTVAPEASEAPDVVGPAIPATAHGGPMDRAARSLGPDLARGLMLAWIALANVWGYLYEQGPLGPGFRPLGGSTIDHVVDTVVAFAVDDRSWPMFAVLYGFGLSMMATRLSVRGVSPAGVRRVLHRRAWALVVLGGLHAALLFAGDILMLYGLTGLLALAFVQRPARVLWRWFAAGSAVSVVTAVVVALQQESRYPEPGSASGYLESVVVRLVDDVAGSVVLAVLLVCVPHVVLGVLVQRAGWLQRPWENRATLARLALWSSAANLVLNLPWALAVGRAWEPTGATRAVVSLGHDVSGFAMGLGYVCLFGWLAAVWHDKPRGVLLTGVAAVGERSLTCYLLQSLAFAPLLSAWGLGWGARMGTAAAAALAVGVWAATVGVALALHRTGRRGPFEVLLRRFAYGAGARPAHGPTSAPEVATVPQPSVG